MSGQIDNPILNSPYEPPDRHFELRDHGPTGVIKDGRRTSESFVPIVGTTKGRRNAGTQQTLELEPARERQQRNTLINDIRRDVEKWRRDGRYAGVTNITRKLLRHWADPKRENRVIFAQREAAETVIFLTDVARRQRWMDWRKRLELQNAAHHDGLPRVALKMATGAGKTVVMAILTGKQVKPTSHVNIEHVMPQTLSAGWTEALGADVCPHGEFLHRWGNLTLFPDKLNIPASNKPFDQEQPYYEKCEVELTRRLAKMPAWGIAEIEARQRALAEMADALWCAGVEEEEPRTSASTTPIAAFQSAVGVYRSGVEPYVVETSAHEIVLLAERLPHHLATLGHHGEVADRLAADLPALLDQREVSDAHQRAIVRAAIGYFLSEQEAIPGNQSGGLDNSEVVVRAAPGVLGRAREMALHS